MLNVKASAFRMKGTIFVIVTGDLQDTCHTAAVIGKYPGNIIHIIDPGEAEVFIEETVKPGSEFCLFVLIPWFAVVKITDTCHEQVGIFINDEKILEVKVEQIDDFGADQGHFELAASDGSKFIVVSRIDAGEESRKGCSILPENAVYPQIYRQVFGPASLVECNRWVQTNCGK